MKIKGAIFDMDGTLIDSLSFWDYLWSLIGTQYMSDPAFRPCEEVDKAVRTMIYTDAMTYVKNYYSIVGSTEDFLQFTGNILPDFYKNVATVKEGAFALLDHLKGLGVRLCLASATAMRELCYALACHGLDGYFDAVLSCADIGKGKDQPDIYLAALEKMGLGANDACVFEDSYVALETAEAAGFQTVGIYDRYNFGQDRLAGASDFYLGEGHTLDELIPLIEG